MRDANTDPLSPRPLADELPAVYAEDAFVRSFATGLDVVIGPMILALDSLDAYFSARLAPEDFLDWLGGWVGAELSGEETVETRRDAVADAMTMHRRRGTAMGLRAAVRLATGVVPEIVESGGSTWSPRPLGVFPGVPRPGVRVTLRVPDPARVDRARLAAAVAAATPSHLPFTIDVVGPHRDGARTG